MRSAEFSHGPYTIKTFVLHGEYRARAFLKGVWLREISDWKAERLDEAVQRMRASLDSFSDENDELTLAAPGTISAVMPFISRES